MSGLRLTSAELRTLADAVDEFTRLHREGKVRIGVHQSAGISINDGDVMLLTWDYERDQYVLEEQYR